ncbi:hypothetical protein EHS25_002263 [Saitozyma podzolica]|uniref:Transcription factor domain-containing protein n=1 Tax=Saitozyma podzolica TaxID=1890683 RepID=A0A427YDB5_9TREE|nr:hypothetical protein EHS25_002263 [Saitozyma podzolica]
MQPLRMLTDREEAARLRAEGHYGDLQRRTQTPTLAPDHSHRQQHPIHDIDSHRPQKRARRDTHSDHIREKGDLSRSFRDPVALGYCGEERARQLFQLFMDKSHPFMPVLDAERDTWESLRRRSAFCITAILVAASQAGDGSGPASTLTHQCRQLAEQMAKVTLFSPVSALETVQAMGRAAWLNAQVDVDRGSNTGQLERCCLAASIVDMGLHRCVPTLHKTGLGQSASGVALERERSLIIGARIWLALTKLSYEVAYNNARPLAFQDDNIFRLGRGILQHPLSNIYDSRFVISVEFQACRRSIFKPFDLVPFYDRPDVEDKLHSLNQAIQGIYEHWTDYYVDAGLSADHFLYRELSSQKAYATLRVNSLALSGIRNKHDVFLLSDQRRECLKRVLKAAEFLVASIGGGEQAVDGEYGNHYFHVGIVSTARFLIRLVGLMPEACDAGDVGQNIEKLLLNLPRFPGYNFAKVLRGDLTRARRRGVFPNVTPGPDYATSEVSDGYSAPAFSLPIFTDEQTFPWMMPALVQPPATGSARDPVGAQTVQAELDPLSWLNNLDLSTNSQPWFELPETTFDFDFGETPAEIYQGQ